MTTLLNLITLQQKEINEFTSKVQTKITQEKNFKNNSKKLKHY